MYALLLAATLTQSPSQDLGKQVRSAVERAAIPFMGNGQTVSMSIGVYKDGRSFTYNFGTTRRDTGNLPTNHTRYAVASISKTFTGLLLAKAVLEGKVSLDDDVRKYLPGSYPNLQFDGQPIRLWQLINHTSGLKRDLWDHPDNVETDFAKSSPIEQAFYDRYSPSDLLRDLHEAKLTRLPGVQFSYSNVAAQLLGHVLERVYSKSFEVLLKEKITGPLGMRDTKVALSSRETDRLPRAYSGSVPFLPAMPTNLPAAGAIKSTTADLLKYIAWNLDETDEAIKLAHRKAGTTVWSSDDAFWVGLNWQIFHQGSVRSIFQDGNLPGFHSMCVLSPELKLGIIVLTSEEVKKTPAQLSPMINSILKAIDPRSIGTP